MAGRGEEPQFLDTFFRRKRKNGEWEIVNSPAPLVPIADTHAHIHMLADPALSLARAGLHKVGFVEMIVDPSEDGPAPFDKLDAWKRQAGVNMYRMFQRC